MAQPNYFELVDRNSPCFLQVFLFPIPYLLCFLFPSLSPLSSLSLTIPKLEFTILIIPCSTILLSCNSKETWIEQYHRKHFLCFFAISKLIRHLILIICDFCMMQLPFFLIFFTLTSSGLSKGYRSLQVQFPKVNKYRQESIDEGTSL